MAASSPLRPVPPASRAWIGGEPDAAQPLRLFTLPFAGGSASSFASWRAKLPPSMALTPVHLPGRERRLFETPIDAMPAMIAALATAIQPWLDRPYILFGHSMGAVMAYELAAALADLGAPPPDLLVVSGHGAPILPRTFRQISALDDKAFLAAVTELGGLPRQLLDEPELLELVLPALRADFRLCETYAWGARDPLSCPVLALGGRSDPIAGQAELESWQHMTTRPLRSRMFDGNHFFLSTATDAIICSIAETLAALRGQAAIGRAFA
ncbi:thioesterase [Phreatobacter aquaticus]|uniref:Thioesterase n=2 Tax=Phreatobacter aquaticus TaxID=2570229 RepID=A0A4D7QT35_9HYPH|nr:thioesterase [Phreatobacter aquaticus]